MRYKLFVYILFNNIKIILLYFLLLFTTFYLVLVQMDTYMKQTETIELSDIERNIAMAVLTSVLVLMSLILYIIKGMGKKGAALKGLGISNWYVISTFCIGFVIFISAICLLDLVLTFLTLNIEAIIAIKFILTSGFVMLLVTILSFITAYIKIFTSC